LEPWKSSIAKRGKSISNGSLPTLSVLTHPWKRRRCPKPGSSTRLED